MSILDRAIANIVQTRSTTGDASGISFLGGFGLSGISTAGKQPFTLAAFYNGVDQISNDIAKLPKSVYLKQGENRFPYPEHPVNILLSSSPNEMMTSFDFWKLIIVLVIYKGNAFVKINRNASSGKQSSWIVLENQHVNVFEKDNKLYYKHKNETIDGADMMHFKGFSFDGKIGVSVVTFAAKALGIALNAQEYATAIYEDKGIGYGVIESEQDVNVENKKIIEQGFATKMAAKSKFKVPMLDSGMKYKSISLNPAEAELLATRKDLVVEVCRFLNLSPYKLKDLTNANYSNMQQLAIEHMQDSLLPWIARIEQELYRKVFTDSEKQNLYIKLNEKFLLRGDLESRRNFYRSMVDFGGLTPNEIRALEDMNPIDGGDEPLRPVNLQTWKIANANLLKSNDNGSAK
jgi:HK97 family phage portal protein